MKAIAKFHKRLNEAMDYNSVLNVAVWSILIASAIILFYIINSKLLLLGILLSIPHNFFVISRFVWLMENEKET